MSEQQFNESKSALAFSQSLVDSLRKGQTAPVEPVEAKIEQETEQDEVIEESSAVEEKLASMDEKLDQILEGEEAEEVKEEKPEEPKAEESKAETPE